MVLQSLRFLMFVTLMLALTGCGKKTEKSLCDSVTCDGGVCDPDIGECVNPTTCGDLTTCLDGYDCVEGTCVASFACSDTTPCERGECVGGACVNPDRCEVDNDCVPGYGCDGDQCIDAKCDTVACDRGVCEETTGECVNAAVCTADTQEVDCVDGYTCYNQACADEATVCADLGCARGECSFLDLACVNSEDCAGDDLNCLSGFFCNAVNQCQQNVCDDNGVNCPRGVCEAATGACVNDDPCSGLEGCTDGYYCVQSACTEIDIACEVCAGNQVCSYDDQTNSVFCNEDMNGCSTSIDCIGSRECNQGSCADPVPCVADAYEPNDSEGAAVDWFSIGTPSIRGSVCSSDADYFSFDVAQDPQFTGTLLALLSIPAADVGVGSLSLELLDETGATVASTTSTLTDSVIRLEYAIGNINQGVYTLMIRDSGDVGAGGIEYDLFMDLADASTAQMCQGPPVLTGTQMGDTSNSTSNSLGSACVLDPDATEDVWQLDITAPSFVTIVATSSEFDTVLSLRRQCEADGSELSCENDTSGVGGETLGRLLDPGTYFVVVQGASASQSGAYTISAASEPVVCTASDNTCMDMTTATVCNARGTGFDTVQCANGCDAAIGSCIREVADVCLTALDASSGFQGTISLGLLGNDYDPGPTCVSTGFSSVTVGPDAVFSVTLQPNEVLYANATPQDFDNIAFYIVDDCGDVTTSCIDGANASDFDGAESIVYTNATAAAQDLFLMLDSEAGSLGDVAVDILVGPAICTPGMQQCNGPALETCNIAGTSYTARNCSFGCDAMTSACIPPPNEQCGAGAIDVSAGGVFTGAIEDFSDDYNGTACTGWSSNGADAVYSITGAIGDIVTVSLDTPFDGSVYAVTDCSDITNTCLDGADAGGSSTIEEIEFVIRDANPIYIIADTYSSTASGTYTLTVAKQVPDCTNYEQAITCKPDGTTLQYCDSFGRFADYPCSTTCTAGACDVPVGDRCFDALTVTNGSSVSGVYTDYANVLDPGVGTCILGAGLSQPGPDAIYAVDLVAGDLLTADLTSTVFGASMYVLSDCGDPRNSCDWAAPREDQLQYFANATGRYYLVVDSTSSFSTGSFQVDIGIQGGFVCQPNSAACDLQSDTLTLCNFDGTLIENTVVCPNGCANATACAGSTTVNDTCMDAEAITGSIRFADTWARFTNVLDPGQTMGNSCDIADYESDGPEAIYSVLLNANDVVDVTVDDLGAFGTPNVYIVTDCNDTENTCVGNDITGPVARAGYVSQLGETVYVVVDNTDSTVDDPFIVDIDIRPAQCVANSSTCLADTREYCDQFGILQSEDCFFGCAAGACVPPTNNTCATPADLTGGGTATVPYTGFTNDYGMSTLACTGFAANGPEAVFSFVATAGDFVTATLTSPGVDTSLWITTTCGDGAACIAGSDSGTVEEVQFLVPADGTYFLMADTYTSSPSGSFTVDLVIAPPICTPGDAACDLNGTNVEACNGTGSAVDVFQCDTAGCISGLPTCITATGEFPAAAIDANALGQFTGDYANFVNDFDLSVNSCTSFSADGQDAAYFVDLVTGQTLTATLNSAADSALYFMNGYTDPAITCVAGDDEFGSGEVVSYTATADERIFVIVDAFDAPAVGTYTLDLVVN